MVKRHSHIAILTIKKDDQVVRGETIPGGTETIEIKGRYDAMDIKGDVIRKNILGDEKRVSGEFYTKAEPVPGVVHLKIENLGVDKDVICWQPYQTHSIVSV